MRRAIETVPKDGKVVILEDDASGTYEVACWSAEAHAWVGENGEPSKITPTHWHAMRRDEYFPEQCLSSGPSRSGAPGLLPFSSGGAPQRSSAAGNGIAPHQIPTAPPVTVAVVEEQTASGKTERGSSGWRRFAVSSIGVAMISASFIGMYFREEVAANVTRYASHSSMDVQIVGQETQSQDKESQKADLAQDAVLSQQAPAAEHREALAEEHNRGAVLVSEFATARRDIGKQGEVASETSEEAAQLKQSAESVTAELRRSLQQEHDRAEALASELATARRDIEKQGAVASKTSEEAAQFKQSAESATAELRRSLQQQQHDRAEALASELATARRDIEKQNALASKTSDEAAQLNQSAESATAELRRSLQHEHDRAEALASELATARDIEKQGALASNTGEEAAHLKQAVGSARAELRQSPQQESYRVQTPRGLESSRHTIGARTPLDGAADSPQAKSAAEAAVAEQSEAAEAKGSPDVARLLARANALLGQGNIIAARVVLERAAEMGSAQASFTLAQTYDPQILSTWKTYGTRGDATKARELYAKAHAGGIQEAKDRSDALR